MSVARRRTGLRVASMAALSLMVFAGATPYESLVADAAQKRDLEAVRALLQQGADPNAAQPDGLTGLHWAALNDELGIAEILLYAGATVSPVTRVGGYTPLHLASQSGHGVVARTLLEAGADANAYTTTGVSSLHFAAQADAAEAILALIEHGAEVDARDTFSNRTPLMFAAYRGAVEATEALVRADADMSATTAVKDYVEISRAASTDRARRNRIVAAAEPPEPRPERQQARGGGGGGNNSQRAPGLNANRLVVAVVTTPSGPLVSHRACRRSGLPPSKSDNRVGSPPSTLPLGKDTSRLLASCWGPEQTLIR